MVDVGEKNYSERTATARAIIEMDEEIISDLEAGNMDSKKGPVFQTAILAGIMGAKKCPDLIPLCHALTMDKCSLNIHINKRRQIIIDCTAKIWAKTGVEMEALTGATIAALTVYDMCKAYSHNIIIKEIKLMEKKGGKRDFVRPEK